MRAHGGPPTALGVVAADQSGQLNTVLINEGLAYLYEGHWSYVCPRVWGNAELSSNKLPLAASIDGASSWIIGTDDLYVARDGALTPQDRPDLGSAHIVALAATEDALFGLRFSDEGSAIVRIDDTAQPPLFESPAFWSELALNEAGDRLHLAHVTSELQAELLTLGRQGEELETLRWPVTSAATQIRLRATAQRLFAVSFDGEHYSLEEVTDGEPVILTESANPIAGPQATAGGALWIARDGELMRETSAGFEAVGEARRVTCLDRFHSLTYACAGSEIYRVDDEGLQERLFHLEQFRGPPPALLSGAERECEYQWLLFRNDLERNGYAPQDWPESPAEPMPSGGEPDAAVPPAAGDGAMTGGAGAEPPVEPPPPRGTDSGCSVAAPVPAPSGAPWLFAAGFGFGALAWRRRPVRRA